jgi:hypothetical protein
MTGSGLELAAKALYGRQWRQEVTYHMGISEATLRRYLSADQIPKIVELAVDGLRWQHSEGSERA